MTGLARHSCLSKIAHMRGFTFASLSNGSSRTEQHEERCLSILGK